jgi:hypothetical protein
MVRLPMTPEEVAASYAAAEDDETADDEPPGDPVLTPASEMNIWAGCGVLLSWPLRVVTAWRTPG